MWMMWTRRKLVDAAIVRMLEELDPHSIYIPKEDWRR
jgi:C-terminal processing protease CtpA/Prc